MDHLDLVKVTRIQIEVLYQWLRYDMPEITHAILRGKMGAGTSFITLGDIFACMMECGIEAIMVNIDECDKLGTDDLSEVFRMFGHELCNGAPVYFTVTGIYNNQILNGIDGSGMGRQDITLPPLKCSDVRKIVEKLGLDSGNQHYGQLLWLSGGIPRYLQKLLIRLALSINISSDSTIDGESIGRLKRCIDELNPNKFNSLVATWKHDMNYVKGLPSSLILSNIVALCVSGCRARNIVTIDIGKMQSYTIGQALQDELVYLVEHNDGNQSIEAPPILLCQYHQGDDTNIKAHVLCTTNTT